MYFLFLKEPYEKYEKNLRSNLRLNFCKIFFDLSN